MSFITLDNINNFCTKIKTYITNRLATKQDKLSTSGFLTLSGNTLNHNTSVAADSTSKIACFSTNDTGHITEAREFHFYAHVINWLGTSHSNVWASFVIWDTSSEPITGTTLAKWLKLRGFTNNNNVYSCSGITAYRTVYVATTSGGTMSSQQTNWNSATGVYSTDGSSVRLKVNYNGYTTINAGDTKDTVVKIF